MEVSDTRGGGPSSESCFICNKNLDKDNSPPEELFHKSNISFALTVCEIFQLAYDPENQDLFQNNPISCTDCFLEILKINRLINDLRSIQDKLEDAKQEVKNKILENHQHQNHQIKNEDGEGPPPSAAAEVPVSKTAQNKIIEKLRNVENLICEPDIEDINEIEDGGAEGDFKLFSAPLVDHEPPPDALDDDEIEELHEQKIKVKRRRPSKYKKRNHKKKNSENGKVGRKVGRPRKTPKIVDDDDNGEQDRMYGLSDFDEHAEAEADADAERDFIKRYDDIEPVQVPLSIVPKGRVRTRPERAATKKEKIIETDENPPEDGDRVRKKRTRTFKGPRKTIRCTQPGCSAAFNSINRIRELRNHEADVHGLLFQCEKCETPRFFKFKDMLKRHILEYHEKISNFTCQYCKKGFYIKSQHDLHVDSIHKKELNHLCSECGKGFVGKRNLAKHLKRHQKKLLPASEKEKTKVICEHCAKILSSRDTLIVHMRKYHSIGKPMHECSMCDKKFITAALLDNHALVHTLPANEAGIIEQPWKCSFCPKSYSREDVMQRHVKAYHTPGEGYICKYACGKQFASAIYQECHEKEIHEQVFHHYCDICSRGFYLKSRLETHLKTHPGLYQYKCTYCDKMFSGDRNRRRHETMHTGDKQFKCTICGLRVPTKSELVKHTARHDKNNRPFVCECGATFKVKSDLNRHKIMRRASCINPSSTRKIANKVTINQPHGPQEIIGMNMRGDNVNINIMREDMSISSSN